MPIPDEFPLDAVPTGIRVALPVRAPVRAVRAPANALANALALMQTPAIDPLIARQAHAVVRAHLELPLALLEQFHTYILLCGLGFEHLLRQPYRPCTPAWNVFRCLQCGALHENAAGIPCLFVYACKHCSLERAPEFRFQYAVRMDALTRNLPLDSTLEYCGTPHHEVSTLAHPTTQECSQ